MAEYYGQAQLLTAGAGARRPVRRAHLGALPEQAARSPRGYAPRRGEKVELLNMAQRNAITGVDAEIALLERRGEAPGVGELQELLELENPPWRIGLRHLQLMGTHTVASIVAPRAGAPSARLPASADTGLDKPDDFFHAPGAVLRRFTGQMADAAAARPAAHRRRQGAGQRRQARLAEAGMRIPLVGLAKREERLITGAGEEILVPLTHPALRLLMHVRDEGTARPWATTGSGAVALTRSVRRRAGHRTRSARRATGALREHRRAAQRTAEVLAAVPGVGPAAARSVKEYFGGLDQSG